jgi:hypothetical protein
MKYNSLSRTTDSDTSLFTPIDWDVLYSACKSLTQVRSLRLLHLVRHCAPTIFLRDLARVLLVGVYICASRGGDDRQGKAHGGKMLHHRGDGTFVVDGEVLLDMKDRMVKWREF